MRPQASPASGEPCVKCVKAGVSKKAGPPFQALSGVKKRALVLALKYYFS